LLAGQISVISPAREMNLRAAMMSRRSSTDRDTRQQRVVVVSANSAEHQRYEADLLAAGAALPLHYRAVSQQDSDAKFLAVLDGADVCTSGFLVKLRTKIGPLRHYLMRVDRLGATLRQEDAAVALRSLRELAASDRRTLRLNVALFSRNPDVHGYLTRTLASLDFTRDPEPSGYVHTLCLELTTAEDTMAGFSASARRHIRQPAKKGLEVRLITDAIHAPRMAQLIDEAMQRTGGRIAQSDWVRTIAFARDYPALARCVGMFNPAVAGADSLAAFMCGEHNGDHITYTDGASTRLRETVPLMHALLWDLAQWGIAHGASWFDLGGVTTGSLDDVDDPLGGISDFKRRFTTNMVQVGDEWVFQPQHLAARVARAFQAVRTRTQR
jgi:hypothetical protein